MKNVTAKKSRKRSASVSRRALFFEPLEDRRVLATITVTDASDDTLAALAGDGQISLREAIEAANTDAAVDGSTAGDPGLDTIVFAGGLAGGTINLSEVADSTFGDSALLISSEIIIDGSAASGLTISRDGSVDTLRHFYVDSDGDLTLQDISLSDGTALGFIGGFSRRGGAGGGGAGMGGSIFNEGTLELLRTTFTSNEATGGVGGSIFAPNGNPRGGGGGAGTMSDGDDAPAANGDPGGSGGALNGGDGGNGAGANSGQTDGSPGMFGGGGGGGGGAASSDAADGGMGGFGGGGGGGGSRTTSPTGGGSGGAGGLGGGDGADGKDGDVIDGGQPGGGGGGGAGMGGAIFNNDGDLTITNSTFAANRAEGGQGGGGNGSMSGSDGEGLGGAIFSRNGTLTILNTTISENIAAGGGGGVFVAGDGETADATIDNTIIANTAAGTDYETDGSVSVSGTGNLIEMPAGSAPTTASTADPQLSALGNNGGSTFTFLPAEMSPAVDAGDNTPTNNAGLTLDQRGETRIQNTTVDIGSVEFQSSPIDPDRFEENDTIATATILGSIHKITLRDLTIHSEVIGTGDQDDDGMDVDADPGDYFKYTAGKTGKLIVNAHFMHSDGNLDMQIVDMSGNVIDDATSMDDGEKIVIPVVNQEMYFIHVFGVDGATNEYALEIETFAAPKPAQPDLASASDTGMMNDDNVTADSTPTIFVQADLADFGAMGIPIDQGVGTPGAEVVVSATSLQTGAVVALLADRVDSGTPNNNLWDATFAALPNGEYFIEAWVRIEDGQAPPAVSRGMLSEPLTITIDTIAPDTSQPLLLTSSDTGMFDDDMVTNKMSPAFTGVAEENSKIRLYAVPANAPISLTTAFFIGEGVANGIHPSAGQGTWEITSEPLDDGAYDIFVVVIDGAGNASYVGPEVPDEIEATPLKRIWVDTVEPNTPYLDLLSDSGRSDTDDITSDNTPDVQITANDTVDGGDNPFPNEIKWRIYDRPGDGMGEVLIAEQAALTTDGSFTVTLPALDDGVHNLKLEVEDRAGNLSHDFLLSIEVDTQAPQKSFGDRGVANDGLHPDSDSGVAGPGGETTLVDRVTNDESPTFWGQAEANSIIRAFVQDVNNDFVQIGQTVAIALDGNRDADPNGEAGHWELTSTINMNDPLLDFAALDGERSIFITAEDQAGNFIPLTPPDVAAEMMLDIFIDTQGPQIDAVQIDGAPGFDLFDVKPSQGPTPTVNALSISAQDLPDRVANFLYNALHEGANGNPVENASNYSVVGDQNGIVVIDSVVFTPDPVVAGSPATGTIVINFADPLPDDRFTLTIWDAIVDPAGNALDGNSNASQPNGAPAFPSGDGQPGGSFVARFTVDSRAELGIWAAGSIYVDTNGNYNFDPEAIRSDDTNEDIVYTLGFTTDNVFAGNFLAAAGGTADGFDKVAAYGRVAGSFRWLVDVNNDSVIDLVVADPSQQNGLPVAGNFDGNDTNGDEVGLKDDVVWYLDTDHDFMVDTTLNGDMVGYPFVGDFDGDGEDDLGAWADDTFVLDLSGDGIDGLTDETFTFGFPGVRERPVAADFDGDGHDDIGLWAPDRSGAVPAETAEWYILISGGDPIVNRIVANPDLNGGDYIPFTPEPFGNDVFARFGDDFALPVVGNFDPPVTSSAIATTVLDATNPNNPLDANGDDFVSPVDALWMINELNAGGSRLLEQVVVAANYQELATGAYLDPSGDGHLTPLDPLIVINFLNEQSVPAAEGEEEVAAHEQNLVSASPSDSLVIITQQESMPTTALTSKSVENAVERSTEVDVSVWQTLPEKANLRRAASVQIDDEMELLLDELADDITKAWTIED